jgi:alpha-D-xyloside xylohydrolase
MLSRRELLALAGTAPAFFSATPTGAQQQSIAQPELEQHEFLQTISSYERTGTGVVFHCTTSQGKSVDVTASVCTPEILRIQMCPEPELKNVKGLLEIKEDWPPSAFNVTDKPEAVSIDTGSLRIEFQKKPWKYIVYDKQGQIVLQEHVKDVDTQGNFRGLPIGFTTVEGKFFRSNETIALPENESFYGLGERFTKLNKVGLRVNGWLVNPWGAGTDDSHKTIPFIMSTGGYGIFVNTTFRNRWDMGSRSVVSYTFLVDDPRLDYFIIYGPSLKQVLARYEEITGWPAFPPKESFGVWFTAGRRNTSAVDVVSLAKKFREMQLPIDYYTSIVSIQAEGTTQQDELAFCRETAATLGKMGLKAGLRVDPFIRMNSELAKEGRENGYLLARKDGSVYEDILMGIPGHTNQIEHSLEAVDRDDAWRSRFYATNRQVGLIPDFTNPATVKWWKDKVRAYLDAGCFGIGMSDFGEDTPADGYYHNQRTGLEVHNIYTLLYHKATFEAVQEYSGHRGLVNARSGTAGMQRFPICWSGDPECNWDEMASTLRAGLSIGLSGVPFWSNDTGGYEAKIGNLTPELYIRWLQMAMFQSHIRFNGSPLRAPWAFGDRVVENYRKYGKLRYRLLPYIYSHAYNATKTGLPMMRAMVLEFQDDPSTHNLQDQYMFGDALLVAPVYTLENKRSVYLPSGTWSEYETGKEYNGPITLRVEPSLDVLPLYVRENSIIPMGPDLLYIGEKPFDPITLDIRVSSDAECTLFDDDERAHTQEIVTCHASKKANQFTLNVGASSKTYIAKFNKASRPKHVSLNGKDLPRVESLDALEKTELGWFFDPGSVVYAKFHSSGIANELVLRG